MSSSAWIPHTIGDVVQTDKVVRNNEDQALEEMRRVPAGDLSFYYKETKHEAATKIQALFRGRQCRKELALKVREQNNQTKSGNLQ